MENQEEGLDGFGSASVEQEFDGFKIFKLKTPDEKKQETITELIVRLIPPIKSLKADPTGWRRFYGNHYGHYGNNPRNPEKPRPRPFACIQEKNFKSGEIKVHCPKCDQMEVYRGKQKRRQEEIVAANPQLAKIENEKDREKAIRDLCKPDKTFATYSEWLRKHNCDKKWWINVMAKDGSFGVLQISHDTFKKKLELKLKEWRDSKKLDVFHPIKGVWLRFTRTGQNPRVNDDVEILKESIEKDGETYEKIVHAPMTNDQIQRALKILPDLDKDCVIVLSTEKMQALIDSKGDQDKVDEIWDGPKKDRASTGSSLGVATSLEDALESSEEPAAEGSKETMVAAAGTAAAAPDTSALDAQEAVLEAQMKALRERKAAAATAKAAPAAVVSATDDPDDFLSSFSAK